NAAGARLERFSVLAVHRAEPEMFKPLFRIDAGDVGGAKDLLEMVALASVDDIEHPVGIDALNPVYNRREIGRAVHDAAVGFIEDERRVFFLVFRASDMN